MNPAYFDVDSIIGDEGEWYRAELRAGREALDRIRLKIFCGVPFGPIGAGRLEIILHRMLNGCRLLTLEDMSLRNMNLITHGLSTMTARGDETKIHLVLNFHEHQSTKISGQGLCILKLALESLSSRRDVTYVSVEFSLCSGNRATVDSFSIFLSLPATEAISLPTLQVLFIPYQRVS